MKVTIRKLIIFLIGCAIFSSLLITLQAQSSKNSENRIFVVYNTGEEQQEFKAYAAQMARLKSFGRVDVCINSPALKSDFEIPRGSCDWHEYASYNRSVAAFFPDKTLISYIPAEFVSKNRQLLLYKAGVLRELGLSAYFRSNEPRFLPEAFYDRYPHMRGPRVDHPRRSVKKEYAPCFHQAETQDMIDILEDGGMELICYAKPPFPEDTFILGPELIDQLKKKRKIMLAHWTDIEGYLATPFK